MRFFLGAVVLLGAIGSCEEQLAAPAATAVCERLETELKTELETMRSGLSGCEERLKKEVEAGRQEVQKVMAELSAARSELAASRSGMAAAEKELKVAQSKVESAAAEARAAVESARGQALKEASQSLKEASQKESALAAELATYKTRVSEWQGRVSAMEKSLADSQRLSKESETALAAERRAVRELEASVKRVEERAGICETEKSAVVKEFKSFEASAAQTLAQRTRSLEEDVYGMQRRLEATEGELESLSTQIYSSTQFWRSYQHASKIFRAFTLSLHRRLVNSLGQDNYDLARLQVQVWYDKTAATLHNLYQPLKTQTLHFYATHLSKYAQPALHTARNIYHKQLNFLQTQKHQLLHLADRYMERVITHLSETDPSIRNIFPTDFTERCYAFAFLSLILYLLSEISSFLFNTFISTPFLFLYHRGNTRLPSKTNASKTSKSKSRSTKLQTNSNATTNQKTATATKPNNATKSLKI